MHLNYIVTVLIIASQLAFYGWIYVKFRSDISGAKFKVGQYVTLLDQMHDSILTTGGHMPYFGEIVRVRRNFSFKYEYDIVPEYSEHGNYFTGIYEHNLVDNSDNVKQRLVSKYLDELVDVK